MKNIVFVTNNHDATLKRWAVGYLCEALKADGFGAKVIDLQVCKGEGDCDKADVVLFYRCFDPVSIELMKRMKRLGKFVLYFIDDYVFQPGCRYVDKRSISVEPMELADAFVSSSSFLLSKVPFDKPKILRRSVLDVEALGLLRRPYRSSSMFSVGWLAGSGRGSTWDSFVSKFLDSLEAGMRGKERCVFKCFGSRVLGARRRRVSIEQSEFFQLDDWKGLYSKMKSFDLGVVINPLDEADDFCRCKSELKFVEASAMGVPLVTSRVEPYTEFMKEGETGFFASTPAEFAQKVLLVMRGEMMSRIVSDNAFRHMMKNYDVRENARKFVADVDAAKMSLKGADDMRNDIGLCEGSAVMSPEKRRREIPFVAVRLLMGSTVNEGYMGREDTVAVTFDGKVQVMAREDYDLAVKVAAVLANRLEMPRTMGAERAVDLCREAALELDRIGDKRAGLRGVAMLKDRSGSGYWRMVFPARQMDKTGAYVDVTAAGMDFESLCEYETIFVQRLHDWDSFYIAEKLKAAGKRLVYDLDDDIFTIDEDNPASKVIGRDQQMAAAACMRISDCVTTTTEEMKGRVLSVVGNLVPIEVIPNAVSVEGWIPTPFTGSPDGWKRIFWQGGDTHGEDWLECVEAVDAVMAERADVRMVILGFLPPPVLQMLKRDHWKGRVEFLEFTSPEAYFEMAKHVRAEVGLAPLKDSLFNRAKSPLKFLEYSAIGVPTVASDVGPYADTMENGVDGFLVNDPSEWFDAIVACLDDKKRRQAVLEKARDKVRSCYDISKTCVEWRRVLLP